MFRFGGLRLRFPRINLFEKRLRPTASPEAWTGTYLIPNCNFSIAYRSSIQQRYYRTGSVTLANTKPVRSHRQEQSSQRKTEEPEQGPAVEYEDKILRRNISDASGRKVGASLGVRIYHPTKRKQLHEHVVPITIYYPSGLPIVVPLPQQTTESLKPTAKAEGENVVPETIVSEEIDNTELIVAEHDHVAAIVLADASGYPVFMPAYLSESQHISEQLNQTSKDTSVVSETNAEQSFKKAIYPYPKFPQSLHLAILTYEKILQHLPAFIPAYFKSPRVAYDNIKPGNVLVSLSLTGSLIGASLATTISLSEFKHYPFTTFKHIQAHSTDPIEPVHPRDKIYITVELAALSLISPITTWTFRPLGGYEFELDHWLIPPAPPKPPILPISAPYPLPNYSLIPQPDLPTLLSLRSNYLSSPESWTDYHASPLYFFQTPGLDVGIERLAGIRYSLGPHLYPFISMEGTRRKKRPKKHPPFWIPPLGKMSRVFEPLPGGLPPNLCITLVKAGFPDEDGFRELFAIEDELEEVGVKMDPQKQIITAKPLEQLDDVEMEDMVKGKTTKEGEQALAEVEFSVDMLDVDAYRNIPLTKQYEKLEELLRKYEEEVLHRPESNSDSDPASLFTQSRQLIDSALEFADCVSRSWVEHVENTARYLKIRPTALAYHLTLYPVNNDATRTAYEEDLIGLQNLRIERDPGQEILSAEEMGSVAGTRTKVRKRVEIQIVNVDKEEGTKWTTREVEAIRNMGNWIREVAYEYGLRRYRELLWGRKDLHDVWLKKRRAVRLSQIRDSPAYRDKLMNEYDFRKWDDEFVGYVKYSPGGKTGSIGTVVRSAREQKKQIQMRNT